MLVCPWCQAPVTEERFPCPSCGRRPKDHVLRSAETVRAASPLKPAERALERDDVPGQPPPDLEVPDLKVPSLAPPPMKPRAAPPAAVAAPFGGKVPSFAPPAQAPKKAAAPSGFSFDDGMEMTGNDLGSIELGSSDGGMIGAQPSPESRSSGPASAQPEWAQTPSIGTPAAPGAPRVVPVSTVMMSEDGGRGAATRLAAYGEPPDEWWKAPFYAYHVKTRQMDLRKNLVARRADHEKALSAVSDALVVLAERVRRGILNNEAYAKLQGAVIHAENTLRERDSELAAATDAHKRQTGGLDEKIAEHEAELAGARAEEKSYAAVFERVDAVRQRADAKLKRIDIDQRAAVARANPVAAGVPGRKPGAPDLSDPEVAARTAERDARLAELEQSMPAVTEAAQNLAVARRKVTGIEQKMRGVKNERAALENQFKKRAGTHGAQVAAAEKDVRNAMAALGRAVSLDVATFGAEWTEARAEIAALDWAAAARDDGVMLHVMALDVHDAPTVQKGLGLAAAVLAIMLGLAALPFVIHALNAPPPPPPPPVNLQ